MAFPAIIEFKRLANSKKAFLRKKYPLEQAEVLIQKAIGDKQAEIKSLYELKKASLFDTRARKELTDEIYHILVDQGIDIDGFTTIRNAAEALYAEMYGYSILQPYMDDDCYNEIYFNAYHDIWGIIGLERQPLPLAFRDENHALKMLQRLTESSRDGKAAHDNRINSTILPGRVRLRWALPPVSDYVSVNIRKHTEEDMKSITGIKYLKDEVLDRKVFSLLVAMALIGVTYGILGPGGVGKTALLRVILKEVHERLHPRFLISENGAELHLREYLEIVGSERVDVTSLQKWSGEKETLHHIFANFMQAKGEFIIQPEVLMPEEVDNILMTSRRGHIMGPFTFHSYPNKFVDALTDLYLQKFKSDRESTKRTISQDVLASCHYDITYSNNGKQRKIIGIYEHVNDKVKPIFQFNMKEGKYDAYNIENEELVQKLSNLAYLAPDLYEEVRYLL